MSNALAIGAVTAVIKGVLDNTLAAQNAVPNVIVSTLPPDLIVAASGQPAGDKNRLNLFLYQVTPNAAWRNAGLPSRDVTGERINNPPLALNLHYFITAYGEQPFAAEIILGFAMLALHEASVLTREQIRKALATAVPADLAKSGLAEQLEQIKVCAEILSSEEISKLWSATTAHYRSTAAYQVSVVLMQNDLSTRQALPARSLGAYSLPMGLPLITGVESAAGPRQPIRAGETLLITGQNLCAPRTRVRIDSFLLSPQPDPDAITDQSIRFTLPTVLPPGLFAGLHGVQVEQEQDISSQPTPPGVVTSNMEVFVLRPKITVVANNVVTSVINGQPMRAGELVCQFVPNVGRRQLVQLLLNEFNPPATRPVRAYTFAAPAQNGITAPGTENTSSITIPFTGVAAGRYLVRLRVDAAESVLDRNPGGFYAQPQVDLT